MYVFIFKNHVMQYSSPEMFDDLKAPANYVRLPKKIIDYEL